MKSLLTIVLLLSFSHSFACSCSEGISIESEFKGTELIFHGNVLDIKLVSLKEAIDPNLVDSFANRLKKGSHNHTVFEAQTMLEVQLEVCEKISGEFQDEVITIYTNRTGASCGYTFFDLNEEYIIYATSSYSGMLIMNFEELVGDLLDEKMYWTYNCTRTDRFTFSHYNTLSRLVEKRKLQFKGIRNFEDR